MTINDPLQLLGGISPTAFMRDYWQKKPLLVRGAVSPEALSSFPAREVLFDFAKQEGVSSRLVELKKAKWQMTHNPDALPSLKKQDWTLLVQGVDLLNAPTHALLQQFRFVPDARLDDAMFSFATTGGGVGPHFDSYDVFLLQTSGTRRWRIGAQKDLTLVEGAPLKILANFKPSKEYVLEAGDMLYLPPRYAHDGVAVVAMDGSKADCITCSIGFRAPKKVELARELMDRLSEDLSDHIDESLLYTDKDQQATSTPAEIPASLTTFAQEALLAAIGDEIDLAIHLGEYLTEPKPDVWFDAMAEAAAKKISWAKIKSIQLDAATLMMFDAKHIFINGESFAASGADAKLMRLLANERALHTTDLAKASSGAKELLTEWIAAGWCHV
jgi:50S ribosomal protein L16 3-hydroxylase